MLNIFFVVSNRDLVYMNILYTCYTVYIIVTFLKVIQNEGCSSLNVWASPT